MYSIGDRVVYPLYGAGIIESLTEKTVDGLTQQYYVLKIQLVNLTIMLSVDSAEKLGLRPCMTADLIAEALTSSQDQELPMADNWSARYQEHMDLIKSGNLSAVCLVFRNLKIRERRRGLSSAEKKLLTTAKQIIISEIILAQNLSREEAESFLETNVKIVG